MARPPHARERVLDAFEALLIAEGERVATLDATAKRAGVSKGGLLYHFATKEELANAMIALCRGLGLLVTVEGVERTSQLDFLAPSVRGFLVPGSTGDGWQLSDEQAQELAAGIAGARLVELPAAHLSNVEAAAAFNAAVLEHLRR